MDPPGDPGPLGQLCGALDTMLGSPRGGERISLQKKEAPSGRHAGWLDKERAGFGGLLATVLV